MKVRPTKREGRVVMEIGQHDAAILQKQAGVAPGEIRLQRLLVPTDFSHMSLKALDYAVAFARQTGATIDLLHVVCLQDEGAIYGEVYFSVYEPQFLDDAGKRMETLVEESPEGVSVRGVTRVGLPVVEIDDYAKTEDIDLIIIATHGHTGMKRLLMGSIAEKVVRKAPCPVLVVREKEHEFVPTQHGAGSGEPT